MQYEIFVSGRVQGVGFRFFLRRKAQLLGIRGFVENLPNGTVHVIAQSDDEKALDKFVSECWRGPFMARVKDVKVSKNQMENNTYDGFQIF